jgi:hypothetical protein
MGLVAYLWSILVVPVLHWWFSAKQLFSRTRANFFDRQRHRNAEELIALAAATAADELVALPDGRALTGRGMLIEAIGLDPDSDRAYAGLARVLCANETVTLLDGRTMTNISLWLEAQRLNPAEPSYYVCLSNGIARGKEITLSDGRVLSRVGLLLEAVRVAPWNGHCHTWLAIYAPEPVTLPDGRIMSKRGLLAEGFRKSPRNYFCMVQLARNLSPDEILLDLNVTQRQLYIDAIDLFPTEGLTYAYCAKSLKAGETVRLHNGRIMQREQLWSTAINIARRPGPIFVSLNCTLDFDETIIIDGQKWSRVDACLKAIAFEPTQTEHYVSLARAMPWDSSSTVTLPDGQLLTRQQVLLHAAHMEPDFFHSYVELARMTATNGIVFVVLHDGRQMTRQELWEEAARVGDACFVYRKWAATLSPSERVNLRDGRILSGDQLLAEAARLEIRA